MEIFLENVHIFLSKHNKYIFLNHSVYNLSNGYKHRYYYESLYSINTILSEMEVRSLSYKTKAFISQRFNKLNTKTKLLINYRPQHNARQCTLRKLITLFWIKVHNNKCIRYI